MWIIMKMPAKAEITMCVSLIAAMFFVTFSNFGLSSMNIEVTPTSIKARKPAASPRVIAPKETGGSKANLCHVSTVIPYLSLQEKPTLGIASKGYSLQLSRQEVVVVVVVVVMVPELVVVESVSVVVVDVYV
jgi:hypothetical protein